MEFLGTTGRKMRQRSFPRALDDERIEYHPVDLQALAECALVELPRVRAQSSRSLAMGCRPFAA